MAGRSTRALPAGSRRAARSSTTGPAACVGLARRRRRRRRAWSTASWTVGSNGAPAASMRSRPSCARVSTSSVDPATSALPSSDELVAVAEMGARQVEGVEHRQELGRRGPRWRARGGRSAGAASASVVLEVGLEPPERVEVLVALARRRDAGRRVVGRRRRRPSATASAARARRRRRPVDAASTVAPARRAAAPAPASRTPGHRSAVIGTLASCPGSSTISASTTSSSDGAGAVAAAGRADAGGRSAATPARRAAG